MTQEKIGKFRRIYGIVLTSLTVLVGVLFIVQTWAIYRSAPQSPYSTESIAKHFGQIAPFVWLWIVAVLADIVLSILYPKEEPRPKAQVDMKLALERTKKRLPTEGEGYIQSKDVERKEEGFRQTLAIVCIAVVGFLALVCLWIMVRELYFPWVKATFFTEHHGVVNRLLQAVVLSTVALTFVCITVALFDKSIEKERTAYLEIIKANKPAPQQKKEQGNENEEAEKKKTKIIRISLAVVGVAFVVWGICNGGMKDVLLKAINICTQCIGLG